MPKAEGGSGRVAQVDMAAPVAFSTRRFRDRCSADTSDTALGAASVFG